VLAFGYNMSQFWMISFTSAHYAVLIGNIKVLLLVAISMLVFGSSLGPLNFIGMFISLSGFCSYNYFRYRELKAQRENAEAVEFTLEVSKLLSSTNVHLNDSSSGSDDEDSDHADERSSINNINSNGNSVNLNVLKSAPLHNLPSQKKE